MKKMIGATALTVAMLATVPLAQAADTILPDNVYIFTSIAAGLGAQTDQREDLIESVDGWDREHGFTGGLGVGYQMDDFRFELEGTYGWLLRAKGSLPSTITVEDGFKVKGDVTMWTAMAGAYYDFPVTAIYQPYVGGGLGVAGVESDSDMFLVDEGVNLAGFLEAGLNMRLADGLTFAPAYRFTQVRSGNDYEDVIQHMVKLSLRAHF
jgi:opacity protein-like surface antigen